MQRAFKTNWRLYLCEAFGLAIFMISACFFGAMLEGNTSLHQALPHPFVRMLLMGVFMGSTALFIFYSPFTKPSGSHINPAVTLCFLRLGKIAKWDALFYVLFQFIGGMAAVYVMAFLIKTPLTAAPVNYAVTVPGKTGVAAAAAIEAAIAFVMMTMVLTTSAHRVFKKFTKGIAACLVCFNVIVAGPVSGFGMNPARSFASALPAHTWTAFWIYAFVPVLSMLAATELWLFITTQKQKTSFSIQ